MGCAVPDPPAGGAEDGVGVGRGVGEVILVPSGPTMVRVCPPIEEPGLTVKVLPVLIVDVPVFIVVE